MGIPARSKWGLGDKPVLSDPVCCLGHKSCNPRGNKELTPDSSRKNVRKTAREQPAGYAQELQDAWAKRRIR
jgi:hypothetical protein